VWDVLQPISQGPANDEVTEDADALNAIVEECSARAQMNIRRSEATIGEAPVVPKYLPIKIIATKEDEVAPCGIDCGKCPRYKKMPCLPSNKIL